MANEESSLEKKQLGSTDEIEKVFNSFDTNGDGLISSTEVAGLLQDLGSSYASADIAAVMEEIDTDRDGFINLAEFAAFIRAPDADGGVTELRDAFELYDQDHNGVISISELHLVLNRLGIACSEEDCNGMIAPVDADGDGSVDFEEFVKLMSRANKPSA